MAAKFVFTLQPLLDARRRDEEAKHRAFAGARRAVADAEVELDRLTGARRRCIRDIAASASTSAVASLRIRDGHLQAIAAALDVARRRRGELQAACDRARDELVVASRHRRVVEKLRERRRRAFELTELRRAELEIDEANARLYDRIARERPARCAAERAAT